MTDGEDKWAGEDMAFETPYPFAEINPSYTDTGARDAGKTTMYPVEQLVQIRHHREPDGRRVLAVAVVLPRAHADPGVAVGRPHSDQPQRGHVRRALHPAPIEPRVARTADDRREEPRPRAYAVALAHAIADDGDAAWLGEQDAWDAWSEEADRLSLCLTCEAFQHARLLRGAPTRRERPGTGIEHPFPDSRPESLPAERPPNRTPLHPHPTPRTRRPNNRPGRHRRQVPRPCRAPHLRLSRAHGILHRQLRCAALHRLGETLAGGGIRPRDHDRDVGALQPLATRDTRDMEVLRECSNDAQESMAGGRYFVEQPDAYTARSGPGCSTGGWLHLVKPMTSAVNRCVGFDSQL